MSVIAQRREGRNDTVHLYRDSGKAYCNTRRTINQKNKTFELGDDEIEKEYIVKDGMPVGRVCVNCRNAYLGVFQNA